MRYQIPKRRFFFIISLCTIFTLLLRYIYLGSAVVHGTSMSPTLDIGDRVMYLKHFNAPRNSVVFVKTSDDQIVVKRLVGVGGDHVSIDNHIFSVNGLEIASLFSDENLDLVIPFDHVFLLGDNVDYSVDSREFGTVPKERIKGIAKFKVISIFNIRLIGDNPNVRKRMGVDK